MKITNKDRFSLLPKRCDECNALFIFEWFNIGYKEVGIEKYSLKQIKCIRCIKERKGE